jgi:hypothetical protein
MAKDTVFVDTKQINSLAVELKRFEREVGEAAYYALDRTIEHVVTKAGQLVSKAYAIKSSEVKDTFKGGIKKPSKTNLAASLTSKGYTLSIAHFPHNPKTPSRRKYKVKATIKRSNGRQTISTEPKPFIATTGAKSEDKTQYNVFRRLGKARLPVTVIRTLSIPQMITNDNIAEKIQQAAQQKLEERLEHEIIRQMTSIEKKIKR